MHKEMREYAEQNIIPVLKEQRLKLDKKLSAKEKATISTIRESLHAEHKVRRAEMKKLHEQMKNGEIDREDMHEHFKALRAEKKTQLEPIKAIADKHENQIKKLLAVTEANKETWKEGMLSIRRKYISDEDLEKIKEEHRTKKRHHGKHAEGHKGMKHGGEHGKRGMKMRMGGHYMKMLHHSFSPVGFLLWDTNASLPSFEVEDAKESLDVYPNPSKAANKISFEIA